ncbi:MAG: radical SAM protein [Anaerolineae bacterium]|nr:radical SAM protein [Anaerolineae bacterium]
MLRYASALAMVATRPLKVPVRPIHLQIEPTDNCNLDCVFCARSKVIKQPRVMSLEEFQGIIDTIRPKKITLSGYGEPLINRALPEMISYAKAKGSAINTTSNGTLIRTQEKAETLVRSGLDLLDISIDAATPEIYQVSRRQDFFDQILQGIHLLQQAKVALGSKTPNIRISFVITGDNLHQVGAFVQLAHTLKVDVAFFQMLQLTAIQERKDRLIGGVPFDRFQDTLRDGLGIAEELKVRTNLSQLLADLPDYWRKYNAEEMAHKKCMLPWFSAYITADGSVRPCCAFAPIKMDMGGSLFEMPFDEIWNSKQYQKFRQAHRQGQRPTAVCRNCVPENLMDIARRVRFSPGFFIK